LARLTVLEGSRVDLVLRSENRKQLRSVRAELRTIEGVTWHDLECLDESRCEWRLSGTQAPALDRVAHEVEFNVHIVDADGLHPLRLAGGLVRVQADMPPDCIAASVHRVVVASATPTVAYRVNDDFGIAQVRIQVQVERADEQPEGTPDQSPTPEIHWVTPSDVSFPLREDQLPLRGKCSISLTPWKLEKGDQLRLTVQTSDYRGSQAGDSASSEPLYLRVSDEAEVLAAILDADRQTEKDLDEMIDRQLGLGDAD
jgi:hypothetical protein